MYVLRSDLLFVFLALLAADCAAPKTFWLHSNSINTGRSKNNLKLSGLRYRYAFLSELRSGMSMNTDSIARPRWQNVSVLLQIRGVCI
jgi:hypothetical protein